ncbi:Crp/Fnr family transcriptional regulator [Dyadobacter sp. LHD-138]|uniref:Crp/Fnr family transcriptional regulator n=1 Tax=Dyadobacter sp. LHD-138 TaxID=3071413 RepID=UPI0027E106AF|nr:Crp/Fnr family transcriptional regulator [Dyadobacter sp. LHD-138]MDQ6482023.1 Crp/Fnr family transcriptional regulator [Dyadobacter sp. LHD-138]
MLDVHHIDLIETIKKEVPVTKLEASIIQSFFTEKKYKRGALLLQAGDVAHEVFFVVKGALRQFYVDEGGHERTCHFTFEKDFVTDLESFSQQIKSPSSIKTLVNTTCLCIRHDELKSLLNQSPAMAEFFRICIQGVAAKSMQRTKSLLYFSPEKQFIELLEERPEIFRRVPQHYIAQYLGVAPESLSRIKKRLMVQAKS